MGFREWKGWQNYFWFILLQVSIYGARVFWPFVFLDNIRDNKWIKLGFCPFLSRTQFRRLFVDPLMFRTVVDNTKLKNAPVWELKDLDFSLASVTEFIQEVNHFT